MTETLLTVKQIAQALGCSDKTVRRKFESEKLPGAFQAGGKGAPIKMPASAVKKLRGEK